MCNVQCGMCNVREKDESDYFGQVCSSLSMTAVSAVSAVIMDLCINITGSTVREKGEGRRE